MTADRTARLLPLALLVALAAMGAIGSAPAQADEPVWLDAKLRDAARAEGRLVIYSSINEQEGLPMWQQFEQATGVKVDYVRGSDIQMVTRIRIESRADKPGWDIFTSTAGHKLPELLAEVDAAEARHLVPEARDPQRRWYGIAANYGVPSYNTKLLKPSELPRSYEEMAGRADWAGHVANNETDAEWLAALVAFHGEDKARELIRNLVGALQPSMISGHLQLARAVGAGEYWASLNNYVSLTLNVKLSGAPIDFWSIDPISLFFHEIGANAKAPHPNAARLAVNFMLSRQAQQFSTKWGRIPARPDVETNPPGLREAFGGRKVIPIVLAGDSEKKAASLYKELVSRPR